MNVNLLINNEDVATEQYTEAKDPGRLDETIGYIAKGNASHVDHAVQAAHSAFLSWRQVQLEDRISLLLKSAKEIEKEAASIAYITSKENGILLKRTIDEIYLSVKDMKNLADLATAAFEPRVMEDSSGWVRINKKPMGVIACIVPWNAPLVLTLQKIAPIIMAGNTVVVKPSPSA